MRNSYSLYEAKARLSALVKMVREGRTVVITVHGEPAVEMRRVKPEASGLDQRLPRLRDEGVVVSRRSTKISSRPVQRKKGALKRFLDSRD